MYYQKSGGWKVTASTMRSSEERDKLRGVKNRYPVIELGHDSEKLTWIDCIDEALSMKHDLRRILDVFSSPETEIITLTVTEKGYCLDARGELDLSHPGIRHDLALPHYPETAIGLLALGLTLRKSPVTIISCDNLRSNGRKLEAAVWKFLAERKADLSPLKKLVSFPDTMVDRIVPSLLPGMVIELEARHRLGRSDLVATEQFTQWVIEDKFMNTRPDWIGVEFVNEVKPYEEMKLRLLNASHSYLAYAGLNRGYQFVHQAVRDEKLLSHMQSMLTEEVIPLLDVPKGFDVQGYVEKLIRRFHNDKLPHQLKQIAMDGSQKMPQRIFSSVSEARKRGSPCSLLMAAVNEWLEFLWENRDRKIEDPKADELLAGVEAGKDKWKAQLLRKLGV